MSALKTLLRIFALRVLAPLYYALLLKLFCTVIIGIFKDCISVSTYQHNDWIRKNVYWRDKTTEELFER